MFTVTVSLNIFFTSDIFREVNFTNPINFQFLKVVDRCSETQLQEINNQNWKVRNSKDYKNNIAATLVFGVPRSPFYSR